MLPSLRLLCTLFITMLLLSACAPKSQDQGIVEASAEPSSQSYFAESGHSPPFARLPYEPFRRANVVGIAVQEWQLFGKLVNDDPPHTRPQPAPQDNPERQPGHWQRIGEYWWLGQNSGRREAAWTGMHDETGAEFDDRRDDFFAWSAAFVSYVMRTAGAGPRFPYAPSHYIYINTAANMTQGRTSGWVVYAERPDAYAPQLGDLVCASRERRPLTYDKLPARRFAGHCDIVVARDKDQISVIGGNVDHAVTMKHIPVTADGKLAETGGDVLDGRYPWFVVLRVAYDR
jgi:hypothetical protein